MRNQNESGEDERRTKEKEGIERLVSLVETKRWMRNEAGDGGLCIISMYYYRLMSAGV